MTGDFRMRLAELRESALSRLARLHADIARLRADRGAEASDDEHDPDGTTLSGEWSMLAGLHAQELRDLAEIDAALARLDEGGYGVCVDCGAGIPVARLQARPAAKRCIACAERAGF